MYLEKTEGIILKILPFKDDDVIFTIFTKDVGLLKCFCKNGRKKGLDLLSEIEVIYQKKVGLYVAKNISLIHSNLFLRQKLEFIQSGCQMASYLLQTQMEGKKADHLYLLLKSFIKNIPQVEYLSLITTFLIKLMKYEGVLGNKRECLVCKKVLYPMKISQEGVYCQAHGSFYVTSFEEKDFQLLEKLKECKSFSELKTVDISSSFHKKIKKIFEKIPLANWK